MRSILVLLFITVTIAAFGQDSVKVVHDSITIEKQDTVLIQSYAKRYNPRKALLYAAVLPGAGQVYNKKYWKLPLVYGGFYLMIDKGVLFYNDIYKNYKVHLFYNLEHNLSADQAINPQTNLSTSQLRRIVDRSRRERDFFLILTAGLYFLQMIDAHVDAHLKEFDLNPNLHARFQPSFKQDAILGKQTGVSLIFRF